MVMLDYVGMKTEARLYAHQEGTGASQLQSQPRNSTFNIISMSDEQCLISEREFAKRK